MLLLYFKLHWDASVLLPANIDRRHRLDSFECHSVAVQIE